MKLLLIIILFSLSIIVISCGGDNGTNPIENKEITLTFINDSTNKPIPNYRVEIYLGGERNNTTTQTGYKVYPNPMGYPTAFQYEAASYGNYKIDITNLYNGSNKLLDSRNQNVGKYTLLINNEIPIDAGIYKVNFTNDDKFMGSVIAIRTSDDNIALLVRDSLINLVSLRSDSLGKVKYTYNNVPQVVGKTFRESDWNGVVLRNLKINNKLFLKVYNSKNEQIFHLETTIESFQSNQTYLIRDRN